MTSWGFTGTESLLSKFLFTLSPIFSYYFYRLKCTGLTYNVLYCTALMTFLTATWLFSHSSFLLYYITLRLTYPVSIFNDMGVVATRPHPRYDTVPRIPPPFLLKWGSVSLPFSVTFALVFILAREAQPRQVCPRNNWGG